MASSETVTCPRCGQSFTCMAGSIAGCQCRQVTLSSAERAYIATRYSSCLCAGCLHAMKTEYLHTAENNDHGLRATDSTIRDTDL